jgi:hypothetical protein
MKMSLQDQDPMKMVQIHILVINRFVVTDEQEVAYIIAWGLQQKKKVIKRLYWFVK